jgi:DnaK suppressor protein
MSEATLNFEIYRKRLLEMEAQLSAGVANKRQQARDQILDEPGDAADEGVADEGESEDLSAAEFDADVLQQVRAALRRIEDGTFGRCLVDGEPLESKRLDALPWAAYCVKHQEQLEAS